MYVLFKAFLTLLALSVLSKPINANLLLPFLGKYKSVIDVNIKDGTRERRRVVKGADDEWEGGRFFIMSRVLLTDNDKVVCVVIIIVNKS